MEELARLMMGEHHPTIQVEVPEAPEKPQQAAQRPQTGVPEVRVLLYFVILQPVYRALQPQVLLICLLYTSPSPRDRQKSRMPSSA